MKTLSSAIPTGKIVILNEIYEKIEPFFEGLLNKNIIRSGGQNKIKVGD